MYALVDISMVYVFGVTRCHAEVSQLPADNTELREILNHIFPDLVIDGVAKESGQRVVYYCHFSGAGLATEEEPPWSGWGPVVMKICSGVDAATIAYMQMEIDVLNGLSSAFFPHLHWSDVFTEDPETEEKLPERLFVSIEEHIDSKPLSQCQQQFRTESAVIGLLLDLLEGASLLWEHERRLVHRDLKPDNILIRPSGKPVIIDLGILRETGAKGVTLTHFWGPMTPNYASPEQAKYDKSAISFKTDLFALATISYELLTGKNPYVNGGQGYPHEVLHNILTLTPPTLESVGAASPSFSKVIARMMEKEPFKRYRTISLLRAELLQALEGCV